MGFQRFQVSKSFSRIRGFIILKSTNFEKVSTAAPAAAASAAAAVAAAAAAAAAVAAAVAAAAAAAAGAAAAAAAAAADAPAAAAAAAGAAAAAAAAADAPAAPTPGAPRRVAGAPPHPPRQGLKLGPLWRLRLLLLLLRWPVRRLAQARLILLPHLRPLLTLSTAPWSKATSCTYVGPGVRPIMHARCCGGWATPADASGACLPAISSMACVTPQHSCRRPLLSMYRGRVHPSNAHRAASCLRSPPRYSTGDTGFPSCCPAVWSSTGTGSGSLAVS